MNGLQTIRILLVEDNPADARLAQETLAEATNCVFDIAVATNLAHALTLLGQREFDVMLLDLSLPDSQGMDGLARVRAQDATVPIVVLTGLDDEETALAALHHGVQEYLVKGIEGTQLMVRAIRYAIERRRIDMLLLQAMEQAELASRTKTDFLATMSHELRTPLNAIIGFAELMKMEAMGPLGHDCYREYARDICLSGSHLLALINDILDLGRIEAGKIEMWEDTFPLSDVFDSAARLTRERAANGKLELVVADSDPLPVIRADRRKILQILVNLLSNAIKFTPEGGRVELAARADPSGDLLIVVSDTGIGIAAKDLEKAMTPFGQIDSSLSRKYAGTGLGLPLTKKLAEMHGGKLEIASEPNKGTRVTIRLPCDRIDAAAVADTARRAEARA